MRLALSAAALLAAAARAGCGDGLPSAHDPCAGKGCSDACQLCAPEDAGCLETRELKVCNVAGRCVSWSLAIVCAPPDPCAGKACGSACTIEAACRFAEPPCMVPDVPGRCDAMGACLAGDGGAGSCPPP